MVWEGMGPKELQILQNWMDGKQVMVQASAQSDQSLRCALNG